MVLLVLIRRSVIYARLRNGGVDDTLVEQIKEGMTFDETVDLFVYYCTNLHKE